MSNLIHVDFKAARKAAIAAEKDTGPWIDIEPAATIVIMLGLIALSTYKYWGV